MMVTADRLHVLGIAASTSAGSGSTRALRNTMALVSAAGAEASIIALADEHFRPVDRDIYDNGGRHREDSANRLVDAVEQADAVIIATPVHHASYSGLLKIALDHLQFDALDSRAVGLISCGGGLRGATIACEHLRSVVKAMSGWAVPTQLAVTTSDFEENGEWKSSPQRNRAQQMVDEVLIFARGVTLPRRTKMMRH